MTPEQANLLVAILEAAFPASGLKKGSVALYVKALLEYEPMVGRKAVDDIMRRDLKFPPSVGQLHTILRSHMPAKEDRPLYEIPAPENRVKPEDVRKPKQQLIERWGKP